MTRKRAPSHPIPAIDRYRVTVVVRETTPDERAKIHSNLVEVLGNSLLNEIRSELLAERGRKMVAAHPKEPSDDA